MAIVPLECAPGSDSARAPRSGGHVDAPELLAIGLTNAIMCPTIFSLASEKLAPARQTGRASSTLRSSAVPSPRSRPGVSLRSHRLFRLLCPETGDMARRNLTIDGRKAFKGEN